MAQPRLARSRPCCSLRSVLLGVGKGKETWTPGPTTQSIRSLPKGLAASRTAASARRVRRKNKGIARTRWGTADRRAIVWACVAAEEASVRPAASADSSPFACSTTTGILLELRALVTVPSQRSRQAQKLRGNFLFASLFRWDRYASIWKTVSALAAIRLSAGWRRFVAQREFLVFRARARKGAIGLQVIGMASCLAVSALFSEQEVLLKTRTSLAGSLRREERKQQNSNNSNDWNRNIDENNQDEA